MKGLGAITKREIGAYFETPLAYIYIAVFVGLAILFTVHIGQIVELNRADLQSFFQFHTYLYVVFIPALGMRLWAEEFRAGTYEILFALPVSNLTLIIGKYLAGLTVIGIALLLCIPFWIAMNILGNVDNMVALVGFVGSFLVGAAFLAVTLALSAMAKNQIIVFVLSVFVCFIFASMGLPLVLNSLGALFGDIARNVLTIFSISDAFDLMTRGFVPLSALVFFISFVAMWLLIAYIVILQKRGLLSSGKVIKKLRPVALVFMAIIAFGAVNILAGSLLRGIGIDATADRLFTLSKASHEIVKANKNPMYLDFYFSKTAASQNPLLRAYGQRVSDILQSYAQSSNGKIIFREHDVEQFTDSEDEAIQNGLMPYHDNENIENDIYFGLVVKSMGKQAIIPFFSPELEDNLEYTLSKTIADFNKSTNMKIGIITSLPWFFDGQIPNNSIAKNIADNFQTININPAFDALPDGLNILILAAPPEMTLNQLKLIDNYMSSGGKTIIFSDPVSSLNSDNGVADVGVNIGLNNILAKYGVNFSQDVVIDKNGALPVQTNFEGRNIVAPQPLYFNAADKGNNPIIAKFTRGINVASSGFIQFTPVNNYKFEPLLSTSPNSMIIAAELAKTSPTPQRLLGDFKDGNQKLPLAGIITGANNVEIALIADTDLLSEGLYSEENQKIADNADLVMNIIDFMAGDNALMDLRAKTPIKRTLKLVEGVRASSETQIIAKQTELQEELKQYQKAIEDAQNPSAALFNNSGNKIEAQQDLKNLQNNLIRTRKELRDLQNSVRNNIGAVKSLIILICGFVFPLSFLIFGIVRYIRNNRVWSN